jgi:hypothetical protein
VPAKDRERRSTALAVSDGLDPGSDTNPCRQGGRPAGADRPFDDLVTTVALWAGDVAVAELIGAAGTVARSEKMQVVHHVVVTTSKRPINAGGLEDI